MIIRIFSIRSKLIMTTVVIVLLFITLALIFIDASHQNDIRAKLTREQSLLHTKLNTFHTSFQRLVLDDESHLTANCISQIHGVEEQLRIILQLELVTHLADKDQVEQLDRKSKQIITCLDRFAGEIRTATGSDSGTWIQARTESQILRELINELDNSLVALNQISQRKIRVQLGISMALGILLATSLLVFFSVGLGN